MYHAKTTPENQDILVKFTRRYSVKLHELCAERGEAPQLFGYEEVPGGWLVIAMQYMPDAVHLPDLELPDRKAHLEQWKTKMETLVDVFHSRDLVHGDLRDANIMIDDSKVMLIDFDWGGKAGEVSFPTRQLNPELSHGRTADDLKITKEDDKRVLAATFAKY